MIRSRPPVTCLFQYLLHFTPNFHEHLFGRNLTPPEGNNFAFQELCLQTARLAPQVPKVFVRHRVCCCDHFTEDVVTSLTFRVEAA